MLTRRDRLVKRTFDIVVSLLALVTTSWLIGLGFVLATIDTRRNGFFTQVRIGQHGRPFRVIKIRTMRDLPACNTTVTTTKDPRITILGRILRATKIDEFPQFLNVLLGQMSLVGPRPDVPGFADRLEREDRVILSVKPGITGPATLAYRDEERLLAIQENPERYNREVLYPEKVRLNCQYVEQYSFRKDLVYLWRTMVGRKLE